jgi:hypothetical protein
VFLSDPMMDAQGATGSRSRGRAEEPVMAADRVERRGACDAINQLSDARSFSGQIYCSTEVIVQMVAGPRGKPAPASRAIV